MQELFIYVLFKSCMFISYVPVAYLCMLFSLFKNDKIKIILIVLTNKFANIIALKKHI